MFECLYDGSYVRLLVCLFGLFCLVWLLCWFDWLFSCFMLCCVFMLCVCLFVCLFAWSFACLFVCSFVVLLVVVLLSRWSGVVLRCCIGVLLCGFASLFVGLQCLLSCVLFDLIVLVWFGLVRCCLCVCLFDWLLV